MKMLKSRNPIEILIISGCLILLAGCAALAIGAAAGAAGLAYTQGALRTTVNANPSQFITAAEQTLHDMKITVQGSASDDVDGHVNGTTANGRNVTITATHNVQGGSNITIRVGTFGDEALSREIYNRIEKKL